MISTFQIDRNRLNAEEKDSCATAEDFQHLFATEMGNLFHLSLQLTGDAKKAESCLLSAMRGCFFSSAVSKEMAHIWARRMVIRNAIRSVLGRENAMPSETEAGVCLQPSRYRIDVLRESPAILGLPDFDRLAFVICALERHSILDAALLLGKTPREVNDAIVRAANEAVSNEERNHPGTSGRLRTNTYFSCCYYGAELDGSSEAILD